ncbi:ABC transporter substrate-binding protein [Microtetraspora malaysiensis]|uniref:ABC transporter substrate-binding protein n=1 Tax=Microtetraspora malaysiensis TaxID=161358 RepID=UPI003D939916
MSDTGAHGRFSRRTLFVRGGQGLGLLAASGVLSACGGGFSSSPGGGGGGTTLTIASYGGDYQKFQAKALWGPYAATNGITVKEDGPSDNAKIKAQAESGNPSWDIVVVGNDFGGDADAKWLEPIDYSVIDKSSIIEGYAQTYRICADVEGTVLAYRSDKTGATAPKPWVDFFDVKKYPGKRTAWKSVGGGIFEMALLADGVAPADLYPIDVDRALKKLATIKDQLIWWETGAQAQQYLESGEAVMGMVWIARALQSAANAPIAIAWDSWLSQEAYWVVPKGTKNKAEAMKLISHMTSAEATAELTKYLPYGPVNVAAQDKIDPSAKDNLPTTHLDTQIKVNDVWWGENRDAVNDRFQQWLLS